MPWLINPTQLEKFKKNQKNIIILDASFHLAEAKRDAFDEFKEKHIIDAKFFDFNQLTNLNSSVANALIHDEKIISEKLGNMGIRNDYKIIFYDNSDLHSACRAVWMMKYFGHNPQLLYILDGGLNAWVEQHGKTESGNHVATPKTYTAKLHPQYIRTLKQMKENLENSAEQIVDMRSGVRFAGGKESRENMRSGHIPGSISFPFTTMFETNGTFKPLDKLKRQLADVAIDSTCPIITLCGGGMTATILNFVLDLMGNEKNALYAGSWSEWGSTNLYPDENSLSERPVATCLD